MRYQCSFGWSGLVQTNSLVNLVISTSIARIRGYLAPTAVALANVTTEPQARVCGRPAVTLEIKNIFAAPGERMELRKSTAGALNMGNADLGLCRHGLHGLSLEKRRATPSLICIAISARETAFGAVFLLERNACRFGVA